MSEEMTDSSELKRRMKVEKAKEKAEKVASQAPAGAEKEKSKREQEEEIDPNEYLKLRTQHVTKLKEEGTNPYPHKFDVQMSLEEFIKRFKEIKNGTILDQEIKVAGRVHAMRPSGAKLNFYDLRARGEGVKIQIMANAKYYISEEEYRLMDERLRRGGMVGVRGKPEIHTNNVENMWSRAKTNLKGMSGTSRTLFPTYLREFMWRNEHRDSGNFFGDTIVCIADQYNVG